MPHSSTPQTWRQTNREKSPHHPGRGPRASFVHCYILYLSDGTVFGMFPQIPNASHTYRAWSGLELKNLFVGLEIYPETSCFHKGPLFIPRNSAKEFIPLACCESLEFSTPEVLQMLNDWIRSRLRLIDFWNLAEWINIGIRLESVEIEDHSCLGCQHFTSKEWCRFWYSGRGWGLQDLQLISKS